MCNNKSNINSNESTSDSVDQLVDADAANEVVADDESNLGKTTLKDNIKKYYKAARSEKTSQG